MIENWVASIESLRTTDLRNSVPIKATPMKGLVYVELKLSVRRWIFLHRFHKSPYDRILTNIKSPSSIVAVASMNKAAKEEISPSETNEICVSGDGTSKTRGYTSRIGVCSISGDITGKVIDIEVLSSYCKKSVEKSEIWNIISRMEKSHEPYCVKNHSDSSNKMEVEGMKRIFR
ncbi:uncharacterized protein TNCV_2487931 [Trichonephila clavipes]|uniref:Mutator-like transposase domain-containing protein n=1 Tax=Trichonephila clavipes TaxID=2585209 RepID=A0A8X6VZW4_TRICX|nr:uncharacterized protein TNCV_2487931 [Trichonephila clavipes]